MLRAATRASALARLQTDLVSAALGEPVEPVVVQTTGDRHTAAALRRLGKTFAIDEVLDPSVVLPQVGQGALAVECRAGDVGLRERLAAIEHGPSRQALEAERAYLREIGEGCQLPVGALATVDADGRMTLTGMIATLDGHTLLRHSDVGDDPVTLGRSVARHLLDDGGATALLSEVEA